MCQESQPITQDIARQIFEKYSPSLLRQVHSVLGSKVKCKVDEEDIVQSVFRTFFRRVTDLGEVDSLTAYLRDLARKRTINKVKALTAAKRDIRIEVAVQNENSFEGVLDEGIALFDLLDMLPPELQTIAILTIHGCTQREIANVLVIRPVAR